MYRFLTASKELRQRARSALLDAYRRFVVQELKSRLPHGGYTVWIAQSTLRRTEEHMASLAEFTASTVSLPLPDISFDCQTATVPEDLFAYDDDMDAASETASLSRTVGTESDGSSVHTPDSTCAFRHGTPAALMVNDPNAEAFAALSRRALRLREHLHRAEAAQRSVATGRSSSICHRRGPWPKAGLAEPATPRRRAPLAYRLCNARTVIAARAIRTCYRVVVEPADCVSAIVPGSGGERGRFGCV
jgi:hypothetical protein